MFRKLPQAFGESAYAAGTAVAIGVKSFGLWMTNLTTGIAAPAQRHLVPVRVASRADQTRMRARAARFRD